MNPTIFPEIKFHKDFEEFSKDSYFRMIRHIKSGIDLSESEEYVSNEASNILKFKVFKEFCEMAGSAGFKSFIPLKGMYLFNTLFEDFQGLRRMSDLDFLMLKNEFARLPEFIAKHTEFHIKSNFPLKLRRHFGEDMSFIFKDVLIEIHSRVSLARFPKFMNEIFSNTSAKSTHDGLEIQAPDIEHELLLMLLHDYARDDFLDLKCRRLLEFYVVLYNCDMNKVVSLAQKHGLSKMLECHLFMLYTMIEQPFFERNSFTINETFGYIEKSNKFNGFTVTEPMKLQKALYGNKWYFLRMRNVAAAAFKNIFLRNSKDI